MVVMVVLIATIGALACICIQFLKFVYFEGEKINTRRRKVKVHQRITRYRRMV